jgi:acyl-CoA thioester hydrolase
MERARTEWLRALGFEQDELIRNRRLIFAVRGLQVDYLSPARFNDQLHVGVVLTKVGRASITLDQEVRRVGSDKPLCAGCVKIACLDSETFKPRPIPQDIAACLAHE